MCVLILSILKKKKKIPILRIKASISFPKKKKKKKNYQKNPMQTSKKKPLVSDE